MKEVWADIYGYEGKYQVSTWGRVRNQNKILSPYKNSKGYLKVGLCRDGETHKFRVNRLVANTFIPNYANQCEVNHIDGNKDNNSVTNLEWVTPNQNREHEREFIAKIEFGIEACRRLHYGDDDDDE